MLVHALINSNDIVEAGELLGYSDNPIKQCIRQVLAPIFPERSRSYFDGGGLSDWRNTLLFTIKHKYCPSCNFILSISNFREDLSRKNNITSSCKSCLILKSIKEKDYITQRTPSWSEEEKIKEFYRNCPYGYHVDHIIPLRGKIVSGLHVLSNLQYLMAKDNIQKSNKYAEVA